MCKHRLSEKQTIYDIERRGSGDVYSRKIRSQD